MNNKFDLYLKNYKKAIIILSTSFQLTISIKMTKMTQNN